MKFNVECVHNMEKLFIINNVYISCELFRNGFPGLKNEHRLCRPVEEALECVSELIQGKVTY